MQFVEFWQFGGNFVTGHFSGGQCEIFGSSGADFEIIWDEGLVLEFLKCLGWF